MDCICTALLHETHYSFTPHSHWWWYAACVAKAAALEQTDESALRPLSDMHSHSYEAFR